MVLDAKYIWKDAQSSAALETKSVALTVGPCGSLHLKNKVLNPIEHEELDAKGVDASRMLRLKGNGRDE